jgi:UDP-N-acetylglucosamine 3-dehydrogenase
MVEQFGGKGYNTVEEMMADKTVEAVSVCTANNYHAPFTIVALQAGKHYIM